MGLFTKKRKEVQLPPVLQQQDPVNYNSVLDYMVGLSRYDYEKLLKVTDIYRDANKTAAKVLGVANAATTTLGAGIATDQEIEDALDTALNGLEFLESDPANDSPVKIDKKSKPQPSDK